MGDIYLSKLPNGSFAPADNDAILEMPKFKIGEVYRFKYSKPRNYRFHKKYFALLSLAFDNQEDYEEFQHFRDAVTMQAGWYDSHMSLSGNLVFKPKSISFSKMDDCEFSKIYSKTINVILKYIMAGSTQDEIEKVLNFS